MLEFVVIQSANDSVNRGSETSCEMKEAKPAGCFDRKWKYKRGALTKARRCICRYHWRSRRAIYDIVAASGIADAADADEEDIVVFGPATAAANVVNGADNGVVSGVATTAAASAANGADDGVVSGVAAPAATGAANGADDGVVAFGVAAGIAVGRCRC